ncbi:MAG: flagellar motor switch protein FliG [Nitrospinota bacterium]|nr:MAG: flagellar motor switch protein FliG [Nitrospinota bacterium]
MERELTGPEKAAILLLAIGEDLAALILRHMNDQEIQRVSNYMAHMRDIEPEATTQVLEEFCEMASGVEGLTAGGKEYVKKLLLKSLDPEKAEWIINNLSLPTLETGIEALRWLDPKTIARFLQSEHPQTIAVILAHLDPQQAGAILGLLPEELKPQVILRIAKLERIPPGVIQELDQVLQSELRATGALETDQVGGVQSVAEILNNVDQASEREIMEYIEEVDANLAEEIRQLMFVFEDLNTLDDRSLQLILREVSNEDLILALKTASEALRTKIFKNMSQRAAEMVREELETMGPVRISDVERAQQKMLRVAKRLESEGKIIIGGRGGETLV